MEKEKPFCATAKCNWTMCRRETSFLLRCGKWISGCWWLSRYNYLHLEKAAEGLPILSHLQTSVEKINHSLCQWSKNLFQYVTLYVTLFIMYSLEICILKCATRSANSPSLHLTIAVFLLQLLQLDDSCVHLQLKSQLWGGLRRPWRPPLQEQAGQEAAQRGSVGKSLAFLHQRERNRKICVLWNLWIFDVMSQRTPVIFVYNQWFMRVCHVASVEKVQFFEEKCICELWHLCKYSWIDWVSLEILL